MPIVDHAPRLGARPAARPGPDPARRIDNTVHDVVALANDVERHVAEGLRRRRDLRPGFVSLLAFVPRDGITQGVLAEALNTTVQSTSATLALAEQAGFVVRIPHPTDGRAKVVVLTDRGRRVVDRAADLLAASSDRAASHLGEVRAVAFTRSLETLATRLALHRSPVRHAGTSSATLVRLAADAVRAMHAGLLAAGHADIRRAQTAVLVQIAPSGSRASELARTMRLTRQSVSATLHELEALGYVQRRDAAHDRRGVVFTPTTRGDRFVRAYVAAVDAVEHRWAGVLGPADWAAFVDAAHHLHRCLRLGAPGDRADRRAHSDRALADLAAELRHQLGHTDAARLARLLHQPPEEEPSRTGTRTERHP